MKKQLLRTLALLACLALVALSLVSCGSSSKVLMTLEDQTMTVNTYELLLSRMKGTLEYNGYPTEEDAFWDQIVSTKGATYDDFFCYSIQNEAKKMLVQLYLFEQVYDLTLPQSSLDSVEEVMNDILELSFDGSKSAMNSYLAAFGVNIDMLRENYVADAKIDHLKAHLASITSDAAKEEYYNEHYVCFRQILLPLYEYCYETDENGDVIYYRENSERIYYDAVNGNTRTGTDGKSVVDKNGDSVYYTDDGRIAYNSEKGIPHGKDEDNDGYVDYVALSDEKKRIVTDRANALDELISDGDFTTFEEYGELWSEDDVWSTYPNGIFINLSKKYEVNYLDDIQTELADMKAGDTVLVQSENAYHFIMKYELATQGYNSKDNADWFNTFEDEVVTDILDAMCEQYIDQIAVNDEALKQAKTMKTIGSNTEY